jgi:hypothetical protein
MIRITVGAGRRNTHGRSTAYMGSSGGGPVGLLQDTLNNIPAEVDAWWSPHIWKDNTRAQAGWQSSQVVACDIDYHDAKGTHAAPDQSTRTAIEAEAKRGVVPGNLFYSTPRGFRLIFVLPDQITDPGQYEAVAREICDHVQEWIDSVPWLSGYMLDAKVSPDRARFFFTHNAIVDDVHRNGTIILITPEVKAWNGAKVPTGPSVPAVPSADFHRPVSTENWTSHWVSTAAAEYSRRHPRRYPKSNGDCPICEHKGCFGQLKGDLMRWSCFSANHTVGGRQINGVWCGDAADIDAYLSGVDVVTYLAHLKAQSFEAANVGKKPAEEAEEEEEGVPPRPKLASKRKIELPESAPPADEKFKPTFARLCECLSSPTVLEFVLGQGALEYNEMTMMVTLDRKDLTDLDTIRVRQKLEKLNPDWKFRKDDIDDALQLIAWQRSYHPVREYLKGVEWDGKPRVDTLAQNAFGIPIATEKGALASHLLRKWLLSAAARAMVPGCHVDHVLILVGEQGINKSTFFRVLAGEDWFLDAPLDIGSKDAYMQIRYRWIIEWAELESLQRARHVNSVKAFISQRGDIFRPPFGRKVINSPRSCVFVGTTNENGFLADNTGNRRYWPIECLRPVDVDYVIKNRDQIWAEVMTAYSAGENWHEIPLALSAQLEGSREQYQDHDLWEPIVLGWSSRQQGAFTLAQLAQECLDKPAGICTRSDQMRIAALLGRANYKKIRVAHEGVRLTKWIRG